MIMLICAGWIPHDKETSGAASIYQRGFGNLPYRIAPVEDSPFEACNRDPLYPRAGGNLLVQNFTSVRLMRTDHYSAQ